MCTIFKLSDSSTLMPAKLFENARFALVRFRPDPNRSIAVMLSNRVLCSSVFAAEPISRIPLSFANASLCSITFCVDPSRSTPLMAMDVVLCTSVVWSEPTTMNP